MSYIRTGPGRRPAHPVGMFRYHVHKGKIERNLTSPGIQIWILLPRAKPETVSETLCMRGNIVTRAPAGTTSLCPGNLFSRDLANSCKWTFNCNIAHHLHGFRRWCMTIQIYITLQIIHCCYTLHYSSFLNHNQDCRLCFWKIIGMFSWRMWGK